MRPRFNRARTPLTLAVLALAGGAVAHAAIPNSSTKLISSCYSTSNGALRVIDRQAGARCTSSERLLEFNQTGVRWRAAYAATTSYAVNDAVSYEGSAYIVKAVPPAGTPPTNTTYWSLLASRGKAGTPGLTGGRTFKGSDRPAPKCEDVTLAERTITFSSTGRLYVEGSADMLNTAESDGWSLGLVIRDSAGVLVASQWDSQSYRGPLDELSELDVSGVATYGEITTAFAAGTYTVRLVGRAFGECLGSTYFRDVELTYLKLGNAD